MNCALCYPEIRCGKVREGQALAMCPECFATNYWRSRQPAQPVALPPPFELVAQQHMLAAVCQ